MENSSSQPPQIKVCHLTSVHKRYDPRIYYKECRSLAKAGYKVHLIVADGLGDETKDGVNFNDVGASKGRFNRFVSTSMKIYKKAKEINAEIYHLHDPELLPVGYMLARKGKKVVYDAHEDVPVQIKAKAYINPLIKQPLSSSVKIVEDYIVKNIAGVITATPYIRDRFLPLNKNSVDVCNYPLINGTSIVKTKWELKNDSICYVGGISEVRGIKQMVEAMKYLNGYKLNLGGEFETDQLREETVKIEGWSKVNELGFLNRDKVGAILAESKIGIVTLQPIKNYVDAMPVKMFEYMLAGLPVVASNFPLYKEILESNKCGICVDPTDPKQIADAISFLLENQEQALQMGDNGYEAVLNKYNWASEEIKVLNLYDKLLAN
ncbi:glycosyltransferase family 4 protein [Solitalea longa]|uniref:glycosyltransferase family 4 protein n=1 Tax=Solitalea longa TaxID=2079460 RepID=UPI001A9CAA89|nr:glycosyltransferase family 4 protein [Solitalea longa]